jgi:hypothetical protein
MSAQSTSNSTHFIEAQQYSKFILENLHDGLLPGQFYRNVSDFPAGTTLNIKTIGSVTLQEAAEDTDLAYNPIDTGNVTLSITDYVGDAWAVTDVLRQDGAQIEQLLAMRGQESTRALQEYFETRFLAAMNAGQTATNVNLVNGVPHRWIADAASDNTYKMSLDYFVSMKLAFDKANVPQYGRIALVDPVVEATLNKLVTFTTSRSLDYNPKFQSVLEAGFAREHKFLFNFMGFDVITSNRLPRLTATEAINASSYGLPNETAPVGSVANIFMCVADDACKPGMIAWRQQPKVESERNKDKGRDEFVTRARFGVGVQRLDTLGVILTSASNY